MIPFRKPSILTWSCTWRHQSPRYCSLCEMPKQVQQKVDIFYIYILYIEYIYIEYIYIYIYIEYIYIYRIYIYRIYIYTYALYFSVWSTLYWSLSQPLWLCHGLWRSLPCAVPWKNEETSWYLFDHGLRQNPLVYHQFFIGVESLPWLKLLGWIA